MAEGARLESVYTATYRGFESPPHRHIQDESSYESTGFFLLYSTQGDSNFASSAGMCRVALRLPDLQGFYSSTIRAYSSVRKSTSVLTDGSKPRLEGYTAWITSRLGSHAFSTRISSPDAS